MKTLFTPPVFSMIAATFFVWSALGVAEGKKHSVSSVVNDVVVLDINRVELPLNNDGSTAEEGMAFYPAGSQLNFLFSGGFGICGYIQQDLRVSWMAKASRILEWQPGTWGMDPEDSRAKFYEVSSEDGPGSSAYVEWADAVALGADFIDRDGDGQYDPLEDSPPLLGDRMVWTVYNDGTSMTMRFPRLGTYPMGLEIQQTVWAYADSGALGDVIFFWMRIINVDSGAVDSLIYSVWCDPDLGEYDDDLVGVDTTLQLAYIYNDGDDVLYGANPPAFGVKILQGATVPSPGDTAIVFHGAGRGLDTLMHSKNLLLTSFIYWGDGFFPILETAGTARLYQEGGKDAWGDPIDPTQWGIGGTPQTNPKFFYSGDPVTSSGWRDNVPSDKRFLVNSGSFNMALGDTQDIVFAYVVARGTDALNSITEIRQRAVFLDHFFPDSLPLHIPRTNEGSDIPQEFRLLPNYPNPLNPFNPSTIIPFSVPRTARVTLAVYDVAGRKVVTLLDRVLEPGEYKV
ncbi:MAG: hypothetical protein D6681_11960, partial [Calditrichaeota bacterium]